MSKQGKSTSKAPAKGNLAPKPLPRGLVAYLNEALGAARAPQTAFNPPGRTFWPDPNGCVRGPEEGDADFDRRKWANAEPLKEMMLRNKHNAITVEARTDAEMQIEEMGAPGDFLRLQQEKRYEEEDRRRAEAEAKARALPRPENVKPARGKKPRRTGNRKPRALTAKQTEAIEKVAECQGDFTKAAGMIGVTPKTVRESYFAGYAKLGKSAPARLTKLREQAKMEKDLTIFQELHPAMAGKDEGQATSLQGKAAHGKIHKDLRT